MDLLQRRLGRAGRAAAGSAADDRGDAAGEARDDDAAEDEDQVADGTAPESSLRWLPERVCAGAAGDWLSSVRADPGRAGVVALGAVGVLAVFVTIFTVMRQPPAPASVNLPPVQMSLSSTVTSSDPSQVPTAVVVSVVGLVQRPGLVNLTEGARVADAVTAAGGVVDGADVITINMAQRVADGDQIVVGLKPVVGQPAGMASSVVGAAQAPGRSTSGKASGKESTSGDRVNLNTATEIEFEKLPGIGPVMAASIVRWRTEHGRFTSVDQLSEVDGIGPGRLEKLRALVDL